MSLLKYKNISYSIARNSNYTSNGVRSSNSTSRTISLTRFYSSSNSKNSSTKEKEEEKEIDNKKKEIDNNEIDNKKKENDNTSKYINVGTSYPKKSAIVNNKNKILFTNSYDDTINNNNSNSNTFNINKSNNYNELEKIKVSLMKEKPLNNNIPKFKNLPAKLDINKSKSSYTPLISAFLERIKINGPLSIHEYMKTCLTHPEHGYYINKQAFGRAGDFITSPEISQVFGELIGIWCVSTWEKMGKPKNLKITELGPGKGTLMADILRISKFFPEFQRAIEVHLVEVSVLNIKQQQAKLFFAPDTNKKSITDKAKALNVTLPPSKVDPSKATYLHGRCSKFGGIPLSWYSTLDEVPEGPTLYIAQEFFDALPVYQFVKSERGWVERMIDIDIDDTSPHYLRYVASIALTAPARLLLEKRGINLTEELERMQKRLTFDANKPHVYDKTATILEELELSPEREGLVEKISIRIKKNGGSAIIIDYGKNSPFDKSLEGIKKQEIVSPLSEPGLVDISAHVDFSALAKVAEDVGVCPFGPITQSNFLVEMGVVARTEMLVKSLHMEAKTKAQVGKKEDVGVSYYNDDLAAKCNNLISGVERLVDPDQMGNLFKVLVLADEKLSQSLPSPFDTLKDKIESGEIDIKKL